MALYQSLGGGGPSRFKSIPKAAISKFEMIERSIEEAKLKMQKMNSETSKVI